MAAYYCLILYPLYYQQNGLFTEQFIFIVTANQNE